MMLIDLKLALFVVLLIIIGGGVAVWLIVRHGLYQLRSPNTALAHVHAELPVGLIILHSNGAVVQANAEAQRVLPDVDRILSLVNDTPPDRSDEPLQYRDPSSGFITHPVALRWWRYPLDHQTWLLMIIDSNEYQRLLSRQQAFLSQLAHELRNPLTALIAHLDVVRNSATTDAVRARSLDTLQHETHRLARLVRDLLELQRLEVAGDLSLCPTNLLLVVEDAITQVFPQTEQRGVCLTLDAMMSIPPVLANADRLKQVFLNLLDNAAKFCRPGDTITVRLRVTVEGVRCVVADTGPGIAGTDLPHVRAPLYRGRTDVDGSGIGLALVDEILRRHHATLEIESATGPTQSGTVCSWTLLIAAEQVQT